MSSNLPPWNISTGLTIVGFTPPVVTAPGRVRGHLLQSAQRPSRPSRGAMIRVSKITGAVHNFITSQPGHVFTYGDIARELSLHHGRTISSGAVRNQVQ